jgi:hypothetical protein
MRTYRVCFFAIVALVLVFIDKGQITGDGIARWRALVELMDYARLTPDKYSIVQPILTAPLYAAGHVWAEMTLDSSELTRAELNEQRLKVIHRFVQRFNKLVAFGLILLFYFVLRNKSGLSEIASFGGAIGLLFGSLILPNARDYYSECLASLLSLAVLVLLSNLLLKSADKQKQALFLAFIAASVCLIVLNPVSCIPFLILLVIVSTSRLWKKLIGLAGVHLNVKPAATGILLALSFGVAGIFSENFLRREAILNFGYTGEGFTAPFIVGLTGQLISPTRGILFFIPSFFIGPLLLRQTATLRPPCRLLVFFSLLFAVSLILIYSGWHDWHGSWYWGPRYLLPLSVFGTLYLVVYVFLVKPKSKFAWLLCTLIAVASLLLYKIGISINQKHLLQCLKQSLPNDESCYWNWKYLPFQSLINKSDLWSMMTHRSTAVELVAAVLFLLFFWKLRHERSDFAGKQSNEISFNF